MIRIPSFSRRAFRVWQRNRDVFFRLWKSELGTALAEPVIILLAMGFGLGAYVGLVGGGSYLKFIAPGIIASYAMFTATFECTYGSYVRMEIQKTFDAIIATPLSLEDVIAGEIFWAATRSLLTATLVLIVASFFGLVSSPWAILVLPVAWLQGLMFGSLAMVYTSLVPAIYSFNYFYTLFITPMFFFSGVFFPLTGLPEWAQGLAWVTPLAHGVALNRALMAGQLSPQLLVHLAVILVVGLSLFFLALMTMRRRLIH